MRHPKSLAAFFKRLMCSISYIVYIHTYIFMYTYICMYVYMHEETPCRCCAHDITDILEMSHPSHGRPSSTSWCARYRHRIHTCMRMYVYMHEENPCGYRAHEITDILEMSHPSHRWPSLSASSCIYTYICLYVCEITDILEEESSKSSMAFFKRLMCRLYVSVGTNISSSESDQNMLYSSGVIDFHIWGMFGSIPWACWESSSNGEMVVVLSSVFVRHRSAGRMISNATCREWDVIIE